MNINRAKHFGKFFSRLPKNEIDEMNAKMFEQHKQEFDRFLSHFDEDKCYICKKPLDVFIKTEPCLHWLLRKTTKFKPKHFNFIHEKYDYQQIAVYLRWVANSCKFQVNINDIKHEQDEKKVFQSTIVWENIEWSIDCAESDFKGHGGTESNFPHYHFQMKIDDNTFIKYNNNHCKFSERDLGYIYASLEDEVKIYYGPFASGMQDAIEVPIDDILEESRALKIGETNEGPYSFTTLIQNSDGVDTNLLQDALEESRETGQPLHSLLYKKFNDMTSIKTIVSVSGNVPEIAKRTEHRRRKNKSL